MSLQAIQHCATLEEACAELAAAPDDSRVITGGTALSLLIKQGWLGVSKLLSVRSVPELRGIREADGRVSIGAAVSLIEIAESSLVRERIPALADSCAVVGNIRVRNSASLGGNLAHADHASDPPTALAGLGAEFVARSVRGERTVAADDFIQGHYETALDEDEVLTEIRVPVPAPDTFQIYRRLAGRTHSDRPLLALAIRGRVAEGRLSDLNLVVGAAHSRPQNCAELVASAVGQEFSEDLIRHLAEQVSAGIRAASDVRGSDWYRRDALKTLLVRTLGDTRDELLNGGRDD